jgi:sigma-B regulation protein RsbU (phosphoserine phosphatase)
MGKFLVNKAALFVFTGSLFELIVSKGINLNQEKVRFNSISDLKNYTDELLKSSLFNYQFFIKCGEKIVGVLLCSVHHKKSKLSEGELILLESLLNVSATAIENKLIIQNLDEINKKLQVKISHSKSLFELSKEFSLLLSEEDVYKFLSYTIMGNFLVNRIALLIFDRENIKILGSTFESNQLQKLIDELKVETIEQNIIAEKIPDDSIPKILKQLQIALLIPLFIKNKRTGLIVCGNKLSNQNFSDDEIEFIESIGSIAAISLENIRLFRETLEKQKIEEDIRIAREIQRNLLPSKYPESEVYDFYGFNQPSRQVGGDYFDVFRLNENQILILIADVVGKGISASLVMSNLQAMVKALTRISFTLPVLTKELNNLMKQNLSTGNFITFFWGILNEREKQFEYVNAGHNPPILISKKEIKRLDKGGILLGVMELSKNYESEIIKIDQDDLLVLFTDGFIEVINEKEEELGEEEFINKLISYKNLPLEIIASKIVNDIMTYSNDLSSMDDLTLLLVRRKH